MANFWVIEQDKKALLRIMASLVAMASVRFDEGQSETPGELPKDSNARSPSDGPAAYHVPAAGAAPTLPRYLYRTILKILRPAEWAARRLVIAFSSSITLPPQKPRPQKALPTVRDGFGNPILLPDGFRMSAHLFRTKTIRKSGSSGSSGAPRTLTLPLFDPLPKFATKPFAMLRAAGVPRVAVPDGGYSRQPIPPRPGRTDPIDATRVTLRIGAVMAALDDIPRHALRYARWRDRVRMAPPSGTNPRRSCPLKPGRLPGGNSRVTREVYGVLEHIHQFAWYAVNYPDDS